MKSLVLLCLSLCVCVQSYHFLVGDISSSLVHHKLVQYNAIPFMKRVKNYFYSSADNKIITGIQALDSLNSKATVNITAGGVGYPYVNMRMKSERGSGLSYDIGIYVNQNYLRIN
ncbi:uncharacterized protein LOC134200192 [Bombyx mori]|uniref:uncharacterized protein LOC134200192 n=1 Tax=Bombyx mori TaxID=7091 RepID=UPI00024B6016